MIVTWSIAARIALILLVAVIVQLSLLSYLSVLGATPDLIPVVVVALGLLGGGVIGAVCGFATGLVLDSALLETLGVSSLVLLSIGYLAGRYREGFEITSSLTPALVTAGLALFGAGAFALIQVMLGVETTVSLLVLREIVVKALLALLLALPLYPLIRRVLRSALVDAKPRRRTAPALRGRRRRSRLRRGRTARMRGGGPRLGGATGDRPVSAAAARTPSPGRWS